MKLRIKLESRSYEVDVEVLPEPAEASEPESGVAALASMLKPPPPRDLRPEDKICRSPIAGVVVAVTAAVHQKVRKDDPVVTIEAMKMETAIGAPVDGTIAEIPVRPGESVATGQVLCRID